MWDLPGQQRAAEVLRGSCARGEPGHAWAFIGPPGVGQEQAARALAAALNCPTPDGPGEPCGRCSVCSRCRRGTFSSYQEFAPVGSMHRKDDVQNQWLRAASMSALEGSWKVLRVIDADRMNEVAANTFLKGLEEPPERTLWVLDIADPDELPDTILSRCRLLQFAPWPVEELRAEAERLGIPAVDIPLAVRVASGAPAVLRRLARPHAIEDLRRHRAILGSLRRHGPGFSLLAAHDIAEEVKRATAVIKDEVAAELQDLSERYGDSVPQAVAKQLAERGHRREREVKTAVAQAALDDIVSWCRDVLLVSAGGDPAHALHCDAADELRADAAAFDPARILRAIDVILETRESLELNVQQGLALEACFMELSALALTRSG